jgi:hypothetical protein
MAQAILTKQAEPRRAARDLRDLSKPAVIRKTWDSYVANGRASGVL